MVTAAPLPPPKSSERLYTDPSYSITLFSIIILPPQTLLTACSGELHLLRHTKKPSEQHSVALRSPQRPASICSHFALLILHFLPPLYVSFCIPSVLSPSTSLPDISHGSNQAAGLVIPCAFCIAAEFTKGQDLRLPFPQAREGLGLHRWLSTGRKRTQRCASEAIPASDYGRPTTTTINSRWPNETQMGRRTSQKTEGIRRTNSFLVQKGLEDVMVMSSHINLTK